MLLIRQKTNPEKARIAKGIKALKNNEYTAVTTAYRAFNMPYYKLLRQY